MAWTTWHVYQFRSDTELLYVGYTRRPDQRLRQHKHEKPWWPEVTDIRWEEFATEGEARQREKELWAAEHPKYNQMSPFKTEEEFRREAVARTKQWRLDNPERAHALDLAKSRTSKAREYGREW